MAKAKEEAEIIGVTTTFGTPHGAEEEGTIIGATTPPGSALNLADDEPVAMPTTEPIPVEVAAVAAQTAPPDAPWTQVAEEAKTLLGEAESEIKKLEGEPTDGA